LTGKTNTTHKFSNGKKPRKEEGISPAQNKTTEESLKWEEKKKKKR
jgi:hypothetical protein